MITYKYAHKTANCYRFFFISHIYPYELKIFSLYINISYSKKPKFLNNCFKRPATFADFSHILWTFYWEFMLSQYKHLLFIKIQYISSYKRDTFYFYGYHLFASSIFIFDKPLHPETRTGKLSLRAAHLINKIFFTFSLAPVVVITSVMVGRLGGIATLGKQRE